MPAFLHRLMGASAAEGDSCQNNNPGIRNARDQDTWALVFLPQASQVMQILQNQTWPALQTAAYQQQATAEQSVSNLCCRPFLLLSSPESRSKLGFLGLLDCAHPMNNVMAVQEGHRAGHLQRSHRNGTIVRASLSGVPACAEPALHHSVLHDS